MAEVKWQRACTHSLTQLQWDRTEPPRLSQLKPHPPSQLWHQQVSRQFHWRLGFTLIVWIAPLWSVPSLPPLPHGRETDGCRYFYSSMAPPRPSRPSSPASKGFPHAPHEPLTVQPPHRTAPLCAVSSRWVSCFAWWSRKTISGSLADSRRRQIDRPLMPVGLAWAGCGWPEQPPACRQARSETN